MKGYTILCFLGLITVLSCADDQMCTHEDWEGIYRTTKIEGVDLLGNPWPESDSLSVSISEDGVLNFGVIRADILNCEATAGGFLFILSGDKIRVEHVRCKVEYQRIN